MYWKNIFERYSCNMMADHIFVLSDQNGDLVVHMSFQGEKVICSPENTSKVNFISLILEQNFLDKFFWVSDEQYFFPMDDKMCLY